MGDEVRNPVLVLQLAMHFEQTRLDEGVALLTTDAFPDDDIHLAALVFEGEESDAACCRGALAHEHNAGGAHMGAMAGRDQLGRGKERCGAQPLAQERQRVSPERESQRGIVRRDRLALGRSGEQRSPFQRARRLER